jgi:tol-pal system protein YbgF
MNSPGRSGPPSASRKTRAFDIWFALTFPLVVACAGCATMQSSEALRKRVAELEQQNFQLRKDLAEARVRQEMRQESGAPSTSGAKPPGAGAGDRSGSGQFVGGPAATPVKDDVPRVIYSEQITDASRFSGGSSAARTSQPAQLMRSARERLDAKDPAGAVSLFEQLVTRFPEDAMADDAQFGVGESYFQMGKYEEAITEYQKVVNNFPFGDQVPFAFLKIGFAHLAREQRDLALDNFKTVSEAYPGTEAATIARQQIAHLSRLSTERGGEKQVPPKH